ncbi:MAG: glycosyltransferase [Alphaproteobacteria bacterium]|nr:glycosyltransferase [Alphaproteobacteria bacterium]
MPKVSIITINYNEPKLERTCESIINQTFRDFEWIVIDGGSTNTDTIATLDKHKKHCSYFVSEPDGGLYDAMNKGIARANGDWLIFLNAGDCFSDNETLQTMSQKLQESKDCAVVYGGILFEDPGNPRTSFIKQEALSDLFWMKDSIWHQAAFIRRDMFEKYGHYRDDFKIVSDWAKFAQMYWSGEKFNFCPIVVSKYDTAGISSSLTPETVFMEQAKIWQELQPWAFDEKLLKSRLRMYSILRQLFFFGKMGKRFRKIRNTYRHLLQYSKMYQEKFCKQKMLFIDCEFHKKTKSVDFLVDIMKKDFDCDVMYDDCMETRTKFDISKYDFKKYDHVVFFQLLPTSRDLRKINHRSMFWFPMENIGFISKGRLRRRCRKLKIINFTKIGHKRCTELGGKSLPVQFFIKPGEFTPGDKSKVFFWQRVTDINIRNVARVLPDDTKLSIHLHTAIDPWHSYVQPRADMERKFNITYSEWFPNKSDLTDVIKGAGIYIAPRKMEGIGMSFLEAMSMGKAVIAHDASTMNEYIENGVNGYLVDFENPEPVDLSNIEWVQKNAFETAQFGYARWQNDKKKIVKFIKGEI